MRPDEKRVPLASSGRSDCSRSRVRFWTSRLIAILAVGGAAPLSPARWEPLTAEAAPNACQSGCTAQANVDGFLCEMECDDWLFGFSWSCFGDCLHIAMNKYRGCLGGCNGGGGASYVPDPRDPVLVFHQWDSLLLSAGRRGEDDEFLAGPGTVTEAEFYLMAAESVPDGGFPEGIGLDEMPWTSMGPGTFDGDRFWTLEVDMAPYGGDRGYFLRIDFEDQVHGTQVGLGYVYREHCSCPADWAQFPGAGPSPRRAHAAAFDEVNECLVVFGGRNGADDLADTWTLDGTTWTQKFPTNSPSPRAGHMMVYDAARGQTILHGGHNTVAGFLADTWVWDGSDWELVSTAGPACGYAGMAQDPDREVTVLYGGATATGRSRDTWEFDGSDWALITSNSPPGYRSFHQMVYDQVAERMHMFGGVIPGNQYTNDNWSYADGIWLDLGAGGPSPRSSHQLAWRSNCGSILLYGGQNGGVYLDDLWEFRGEWQQLEVEGSLGARGIGTLTSLPNGQTVLFGGYTGSSDAADAWRYGCSVDPTHAPDLGATLQTLELISHYPNPVREGTTITYELPRDDHVSVEICDAGGRAIRQLGNRVSERAGKHQLAWDGRNERGEIVAAGVYFAHVRSTGGSMLRKMVVVR